MENNKLKISKIYPRDIIALITLIACFVLIALGINHVVSGIAIMIITYYFSKRVYEEKNPNGNLNEKVEKLEADLQKKQPIIAKFNEPIKTAPGAKGPLTTGDFEPKIKSK